MTAFRRVVFSLTSPTKVQERIFLKTKAEERIKKEKAKKEPILTQKDAAEPRNQTIDFPDTGLTIPGLQMLGGSAKMVILHGWWQLH